MVKKRGDTRKKNFHKKLPGVLWFMLGVLITLWTILWLLISLKLKYVGTINSVVLFGVGFYAMIVFILGTLFYYLCRFIRKIKSRKKEKKKKSKKKTKKKKVVKKKSKKKSSKKKK